jgi:3-deoxy-7-phosphoheptulonate synthase
LRGGKEPNYEAQYVQAACAELTAAKLPASLMVDLSHANSSKKHERQIAVSENIAEQIESGSHQIFGVMIESHLKDGAQKFSPGTDDPNKLEYGKSITDACIHWEDSVNVLQRLALAVKNRRKAKK